MPTNNPITTPAGYAPAFAIGFSDQSGALSVVETTKPLPVSLTTGLPAAPLEGQASADALAGPYVPVSGRPVVLTLSGSWEGSVQVVRSTDGGTTRHMLTAAGYRRGHYTANACEPVWSEDEDGAQLFLEIVMASGTLNYRIAQ